MYNKKLGELEPLIRQLKNMTGFHLQESAVRHGKHDSRNSSRKHRTPLDSGIGSGAAHTVDSE
jgi:hypothetical protein